MRRITFGVVMSLIVVPGVGSGLALAQTQRPVVNLNLYGGGTRAHSLGGAFIGLSDDGSAGTWNPAGLTQNDRIYTAIDYGFGQQKVTNSLESPTDLPILYENSSIQNITHFNFLAFNGPLTLKGQRFHLSASWNRAGFTNFKSSYEMTDFTGIPIDLPAGVELQGIHTYNEAVGGPEYATLAMATQLKEEVLSVGFGLNIFTGKEHDSTQSTIDATEFGIGRRVVTDNVDQVDFSGVSFNFGALFQASQFTAGLTVKTPFRLESGHDARNAEAVYEVTEDSALLITQTSVLLDYKSQVGMPLQLGLGLTYRPQENFILAADYEYKGFSQSKVYIQQDLFDPKSDFVESDPEYKDVHQFRFGMEYQIGVGWGVVPVRAGFRTEPLPLSSAVNVTEPLVDLEGGTTTSTQGDQITGQVYTVGTGLQWRQVRFDVAWELSSVTQYASGYFSNSFLLPQFIATRENHVQRLSLGFTGYF